MKCPNVSLRLNCEVRGITNMTSGAVEVVAKDGFRGQFQHVIVTAPLGWLKRNESVFSPRLPPRLSTAIHSLGFGNLDKVFVKFSQAFWNNVSGIGPSDHRHEDKVESHGFPIESLFLRPEYARDSNPARWRVEIISYSGLPEPFAQPLIMFFIYGQWGRHITGLIRGMEQGSREHYGILDDIFKPYYATLPNYDASLSECRPTEYLSTDWQGDEFAGYGSYTNQPIGAGDCAEHFRVLREGMGEERGIWFAGEHTSPPGGLGTVHGAYWSGEEVAKRILPSS
jgi:hypothetical protein